MTASNSMSVRIARARISVLFHVDIRESSLLSTSDDALEPTRQGIEVAFARRVVGKEVVVAMGSFMPGSISKPHAEMQRAHTWLVPCVRKTESRPRASSERTPR